MLTEWLTASGVLTPSVSILLIALAGVTSLMTAALGVGGSVLLLAVMATLLPVGPLIPVHGLVQLGSNANRALLTRTHVDWTMVMWFSAGGIIGGVAASLVVIQLPLVIIQFTVAGFILFLVWGSKPKKRELSPLGRAFAGLITTFLTMFVGATGPLVAGFVHRSSASKMVLTSTFATCMTFQHLVKAVVFTTIGFAFFEWLPLVLAMVLSGFVGTWVGLKVLQTVPDHRFRLLFKIIVSLLALRLIWQAVTSI